MIKLESNDRTVDFTRDVLIKVRRSQRRGSMEGERIAQAQVQGSLIYIHSTAKGKLVRTYDAALKTKVYR